MISWKEQRAFSRLIQEQGFNMNEAIQENKISKCDNVERIQLSKDYLKHSLK